MAYGGFQGFLLSLEPPFIRLREVEVVMPSESEVFIGNQVITISPSFAEGGARVPAAELTQEEFNADVERRRVLSERAAQREALNNEIVECVSCCDEMRRGSAFYAEWDGEFYCEGCYYNMEEQIEQAEEEEPESLLTIKIGVKDEE